MAGMRAASRGATPNPRAEPLLRACLDLVEHLVRQSLAGHLSLRHGVTLGAEATPIELAREIRRRQNAAS